MGNLKRKPTSRRDAADAARLQKAGEHGDTILAHINPAEARLLDLLADQKLDAPRNPKTGLLTFGMSDAEGPSGHDSNPGGVGGGPAGGNTGGGIGGNTAGGLGGEGGGYNGSTVSGYGGYSNLGGYMAGLVQAPYDPAKTPIESLLAAPNFAPPGMSFTQYSPPDTLGRLVETYLYGPPPNYVARGLVPGQHGMPTGLGPGIARKAVTTFGGPMMSGMMDLGVHMDMAMSPESRAKSLAENQATGAKNSTGSELSSLSSRDRASGAASRAAGATSGAETTAQLKDAAQPTSVTAPPGGMNIPPGYTVNPAGQIIPLPGATGSRTLTGLPQPVQNLLMDYIWRGRSNGGLLGW